MFFYFIRHGQTQANVDRRYQTFTDPLSPEGERQAGAVANRLKDIPLNELWSSPLTRAYQTAEIINEYHTLPITQIDELSEIRRATILRGKLATDPEIVEIVKHIHANRSNVDFKYEDGESFTEFVARAKQFVQWAENQANTKPDDYHIGVTTHSIVLLGILSVLLLGPHATPETVSHMTRQFWIENTSLTLVKYTPAEKWRVLSISDFSHL